MKLDKQFLDDTMNSEREETALTIIKYLTKMLKHLGFKVLAEGGGDEGTVRHAASGGL